MTRHAMTLFMTLVSPLSAAWAESADCFGQISGAGCRQKTIAAAGTQHNHGAEPEREKAMKNAANWDIVHHKHFRYRIEAPATSPSGDIIVLLHGSGGDETTLLPFARNIWPRATLVGIRGRVVQKGKTRWYRRITPTRFDENDVGREADALMHFITQITDDKGYDITRITFVGYSNGANLLAVMMLEQPDIVRRAVLMRSMPVLRKMPDGDLRKARILTISGSNDRIYSPFAPALSSLLRMNGARVDSRMVEGNHMIGEEDARIISRWIREQDPENISAMSWQKKPD